MSRIESTQTLTAPVVHWGRLAGNAAAHMTEHLFNGITAVILPLMTSSLGLSLAQAGALVSARSLVAGAASFPSGFFADLAKRRQLLLALCLMMLGVASFGLGLSSSFSLLLFFMALGGAGGGGFHPQSLAILSSTYREKRAFAVGVHDSSGNLGEVVGPLVLGLLLSFFDWRTTLQLWALPGVTVGILYALFGAEGQAAAPRPHDYKRALWEDVLKSRTVFALVLVSTLRMMGQTALSAFLPLYLSLHLKFPAAVTGAYMSILFFFAGTTPTVAGWVSDRLGRKSLIVSCSLASVIAIVTIPYLESGVPLAFGFAAIGVFLWALRPVIITAAMEAAPQNLAGSIVAVLFAANMGVSFLAPIMAGLIADRYGLPVALACIAVFPFLSSVVASVFIISQPKKTG